MKFLIEEKTQKLLSRVQVVAKFKQQCDPDAYYPDPIMGEKEFLEKFSQWVAMALEEGHLTLICTVPGSATYDDTLDGLEPDAYAFKDSELPD